MKTAFVPDANTTVLVVKAFKKGDSIALSGTPATPTPPVAANDLCFVKLNVGPATRAGVARRRPRRASASRSGCRPRRTGTSASTTWAAAAGPAAPSLRRTRRSIAVGGNAAVAGNEGSVVGATDTGHAIGNGSFAMNPDGTINSTLWQDFAERSLHELARQDQGADRRRTT